MHQQTLIVEDDTAINNMIREALEGAGFICKQAFSGTEALLQAESTRFSAIVLDLMLPGLSGKRFCIELKRYRTFRFLFSPRKTVWIQS